VTTQILIHRIIWVVVDAVAWAAGLTFVTVIRFEFDFDRIDWRGLAIVTAYAIVAQGLVGLVGGLYTGRLRLASFEEAGILGLTAAAVGLALTLSVWMISGPRPVPLSVPAGAAGLAALIALAARYLGRLSAHLVQIRRSSDGAPVLVFGAGSGGYEAAQVLMADPESGLNPVAFLDDDPAKRNLRVLGRRVVGGREAIARVAADFGADTLLIAMPSADRATIAEVAREARQAGLRVLILPRMVKYLDEAFDISNIRPIRFADFLGRSEARIDSEEVAAVLGGKRVLVTGAGGSIGSELCTAVTRFHPEALFMLDRDENALHRLQLQMEGRALLDSDSLIVASIRDATAVRRVMERCRPDVVFHAAALKHLTLLERFPDEAMKTNVRGTRNVLEAAAAAGVERFVNISTDKAADPRCVLGYTKRIAELMTATFRAPMVGVSVRFGNVLGSQGSVIPTLERQIRLGGPVTITHPEVDRYFMTIEEAVQLVLQAGAVGEPGEVLVLDMGEPVRIVDLARELIAELDPGVEIDFEFTGLRPGEKLSEVLVGEGEQVLRRPHDLITAYAAPPGDLGLIDEPLPDGDDAALRARLIEVAGATVTA